MFETVKVTTDADGVKTYTTTAAGLTSTITEIATAPFTFDDQTLVSKSTQATNVLVWGVFAALVGEAFGHKREREGSQSFLPIFRKDAA